MIAQNNPCAKAAHRGEACPEPQEPVLMLPEVAGSGSQPRLPPRPLIPSGPQGAAHRVPPKPRRSPLGSRPTAARTGRVLRQLCLPPRSIGRACCPVPGVTAAGFPASLGREVGSITRVVQASRADRRRKCPQKPTVPAPARWPV